MLPRHYIQVTWDDYHDNWRCWVFHDGQVIEHLSCADNGAVVALAQELNLPVDMGERQGRLRIALRTAGIRLI